MNRKLHQLFQPSLQLYFVCLVVFALASALFSLPLAALELWWTCWVCTTAPPSTSAAVR